MDKYRHSQLLHLRPEWIVLGCRWYLTAGVTGNSNSFQSQFFHSFIKLVGCQLRMLQSYRRQTDEAVRMGRAPFREFLILDVDKALRKIPIRRIPPRSLMREDLNIDARFINDTQTLRSKNERPKIIRDIRNVGRAFDDIGFLRHYE